MSNFETWWEREGQEFLFALNTTTDDDIKLVAEIAWKNGAYCAEQAEQEPVAWMSPNKERLEFSRKDTVYGSHTIPLYAAPVRTKDLTDDELADACGWKLGDPMYEWVVDIGRWAIAADRELNK